ncbi:collagen alpha-1(I) chain-like isoform X2 [Syngnathoides biaculeatus]|uniref:collagen alpha-1(I) chain-like isoform X2 n=1 Tax=Syngnathoides biaculeatus TaxID=300417 RepID=UPI002ADDF06B|nr:collagen alpha-1(I) chain-like isoform X2 [Syngnathoides biaculeatus]
MFCRLAASLAGVVVVFLLSASSSRARFRGHVLGSPPRLEPQPTMSDQMSPDFVLMRLLVSAAEYEHLEHLEHQRERVTSGKGGLDVDSGGAPAGPGSASPHYGSPLEGGPLMSEARPDSEDSSLPAEEEEDLDFPGSTGSRAQLMVFRNRMLDFGLEQPPPPERKETRWVDSSESASGSAGDAQERDVRFVPSSDGGSHPSGSVLCHPLGKWSPLSLLESRSNRSAAAGAFDPGPDRVGCREGDDRGAAPLPRCSRLLATGPGEDPSQTSDALLVLEGLGEDGGAVEVGTCRRAGPVFSSGTLSGLMQEVHRLSGVCPRTGACLRAAAPGPAPPSPAPEPRRPPRHQSRSQPQSRATTPKLGRSASPRMVLEGDPGGDRVPWGKPGKAGSLKLRLSKLFRTKSSCGGAGGLLDKRPSLTSSDAWGSAGLWGSACGDAEDGGRPQTPTPTCTPPFTGETVSLVDVEISRRNCLHPPTPPPPPRRSLSLLDDLGAPPPPRVPSSERFGGSSIRSLPPRPLGTPPPLSAVQHSRSLNDSFLRGPPGPVPRHAPPRRPPERPDGGNFTNSLRELDKCGWYWGPMTWEDAEVKLKGKADGSFLVRDSSDPRYILSLSFRSQGVTHHTRMEHYRVRGPLPFGGGVRRARRRPLRERKVPLLPALPGSRSAAHAGAAAASRVAPEQNQVPAAPVPLPHPPAGPRGPHPGAAAAHAADRLPAQVLLLRPRGGGRRHADVAKGDASSNASRSDVAPG